MPWYLCCNFCFVPALTMNAAFVVKYNHAINRCPLGDNSHRMSQSYSQSHGGFEKLSPQCVSIQLDCCRVPEYSTCICKYTGTECISLTSKRLANGNLQSTIWPRNDTSEYGINAPLSLGSEAPCFALQPRQKPGTLATW